MANKNSRRLAKQDHLFRQKLANAPKESPVRHGKYAFMHDAVMKIRREAANRKKAERAMSRSAAEAA